MRKLSGLIYLAFSLFTAVVGNTVNHSKFWAVVDFFVPVLAWLKWLICQQVSISIIKQAFSFFLN